MPFLPALSSLGLVLLAFGGYLNGTAARLGLGVNLVFVGGVIVGVFVFSKLVTLKADARPLIPLYILSLAFAYGVVVANTDSDYGASKVLLLCTLTPLTFLGGAWVANTEHRRLWLAGGVAAWGVAVTLAQRIFPDEALAELGRLGGEGLSYQAVSRAAAAGAVVLIVVVASGRIAGWTRLAAAVAAIFLLIAAVGGGSRGPVLGVVLAIALVAIRTKRGAALLAGAAAALWYFFPVLEERFFPDRFTTFTDDSTIVRTRAAELTLDHIWDNPLGTGWGSLQRVISPASRSEIPYPHNVLLEVAAEAGVIAAAALVGLILWAGFRLWRRGSSLGDRLTLALMAYFAVNALVSGDINSNRGLWLFFGAAVVIAFALPPRPKADAAPAREREALSTGRWS